MKVMIFVAVLCAMISGCYGYGGYYYDDGIYLYRPSYPVYRDYCWPSPYKYVVPHYYEFYDPYYSHWRY